MNKILRKNLALAENLRSFDSKAVFARFLSKDEDKDKSKDANFEVEEMYKGSKGMLHDKQQSLQEESYFHKETKEQLKALKKKTSETNTQDVSTDQQAKKD